MWVSSVMSPLLPQTGWNLLGARDVRSLCRRLIVLFFTVHLLMAKAREFNCRNFILAAHRSLYRFPLCSLWLLSCSWCHCSIHISSLSVAFQKIRKIIRSVSCLLHFLSHGVLLGPSHVCLSDFMPSEIASALIIGGSGLLYIIREYVDT